jgi:protein TonB
METPTAPVLAPPVASNTSAPSEKPGTISENMEPPEAAAESKPAPRIPDAPNPAPTDSGVSTDTVSSTPKPQPNIPALVKNTSPAVPISQASPQYPELARRARTSAIVVLDVHVDSQGKVTKATPVSGPSIFHSEAIKAAMKWRYKPASIDGTNVPSQTRITFNFHLK